jgi:hypothetical protein
VNRRAFRAMLMGVVAAVASSTVALEGWGASSAQAAPHDARSPKPAPRAEESHDPRRTA